jgi:hypothetical protein
MATKTSTRTSRTKRAPMIKSNEQIDEDFFDAVRAEAAATQERLS